MEEQQTATVAQPIDNTMSASIGKLADALAKAQGEIEAAKIDSENPFFKSQYADLESVWNACRKSLSKNGLAVVQTLAGGLDNVSVVTTLVHSSGEWIRGRLVLKPTKADPQGIGSAITYARRYSLAAVAGVAPAGEDDDGNAASQGQGKPPAQGKPQTQTAPPPAPKEALKRKRKTWIEVAGEMKSMLGKDEFDKIIGNAGFAEAKEIEDKATQLKLYEKMKQAMAEKAKTLGDK